MSYGFYQGINLDDFPRPTANITDVNTDAISHIYNMLDVKDQAKLGSLYRFQTLT